MSDEHLPKLTDHELEAYLEEALPPEDMARVETLVRDDQALLHRLAMANARRDTGAHAIGAIWRRHRLTCPSREQLGAYVLGTLEEADHAYIEFHLNKIGCRICLANLDDLRRQHEDTEETTQTRRRRFFQSSAGYLRD